MTSTPQRAPRTNQIELLTAKLGEIEYRDPANLTPFAGNPRKHPERQIVKLMASMREFGFALPVLVDEQGVIIAGEARIEAAKRLGVAKVPVIVASQWSTAQVRAYRLADNKLATLGEWDEQALAVEISAILEFEEISIEALGFETAEIDLILDGAGIAADVPDPADEVPPLPRQPVARSGDLWVLGEHRLLCGSTLEAGCWERVMNGREGAMVFDDPPFNVPVAGHVAASAKSSMTSSPWPLAR